MMSVLKLDKNIELIVASLGVAQSFYLSLYGFLDRKKHFKNILLSLFFFSITLRIVKSILWFYLDSTPEWFLNLGFVAHLAFGPLLFLYIYYYMFDKKWSKLNLLHFLPPIFILLLVNRLTTDNFWYLGGYKALLYHQLIYGFLSLAMIGFGLLKKSNLALKKKDWIWLNILAIGTLILQMSYFFNYVLGLTPYLMGPIVYGIFIYFLSFFLVKNPQILLDLKPFKKYKNIKMSSTDLKEYADKIEFFMQTETPFLNAEFNIKRLSENINLPVYLVSHVVNKMFTKHFSDYTNTYRIEAAKRMLTNQKNRNIKISSIAYECGFNSLSSFNIAFKKHTGTTPSSFKRKHYDL